MCSLLWCFSLRMQNNMNVICGFQIYYAAQLYVTVGLMYRERDRFHIRHKNLSFQIKCEHPTVCDWHKKGAKSHQILHISMLLIWYVNGKTHLSNVPPVSKNSIYTWAASFEGRLQFYETIWTFGYKIRLKEVRINWQVNIDIEQCS